MKITLNPKDDELVIEACSFQEARALAVLYQRIAGLRIIADTWADGIFLSDTGKRLALIWTPPSEEEDDQ